MPMPYAYRTATKDWRAFLNDAKDRMGLESDNNTYTAVEGVLFTFRRRLAPKDALAFADTLPAVLRAIFVSHWDISAPPVAFGSPEAMAREAQAHRKDHNLTPADCIESVAWALRRQVRERDFDAVLARIGPEAVAFWRVESTAPGELGRRFV